MKSLSRNLWHAHYGRIVTSLFIVLFYEISVHSNGVPAQIPWWRSSTAAGTKFTVFDCRSLCLHSSTSRYLLPKAWKAGAMKSRVPVPAFLCLFIVREWHEMLYSRLMKDKTPIGTQYVMEKSTR